MSPASAASFLAAADAVPLGGGTDLLVALREGIVQAGAVVDLRALPALREVRDGAENTLHAASETSLLGKRGDDRICRRRTFGVE
ncbi:MAG: FAD binding domain-containing protein, partial [Gemmatimonadaceae bacterium]|nr:FAD binding domain-containing protein [Gemmatimonadaceae bacterium]